MTDSTENFKFHFRQAVDRAFRFSSESLVTTALVTIAPIDSYGAITAHPLSTAFAVDPVVIFKSVSRYNIHMDQADQERTHRNKG